VAATSATREAPQFVGKLSLSTSSSRPDIETEETGVDRELKSDAANYLFDKHRD
jgi:hypothetical protein